MWGLAEITGTLISKAILMIGSWSCSLTKFNEWVLDETECGDMLGMGSNFLLNLILRQFRCISHYGNL